MSLFQDFCFERDAQKEVVRYIEIVFEEVRAFEKANNIIDIITMIQ